MGMVTPVRGLNCNINGILDTVLTGGKYNEVQCTTLC